MATSLTRDPNFTAALASAISGRILDDTSVGKRWTIKRYVFHWWTYMDFVTLLACFNLITASEYY